jgi:intraflagellar transport protein 140
VGLLIVAKKYEEAIDMCYTQKIILTEEMADKMTLPKAEEGGGDDEYRNRILEKIGDCCVAQVRLLL